MDKFIDARFERLEKALASLIDSVTKYHPSVSLADDLKAADNELTMGLEKGSLHSLYARVNYDLRLTVMNC